MGAKNRPEKRPEVYIPAPETEPEIRRYIDDETLSPEARALLAGYSNSLLQKHHASAAKRYKVRDRAKVLYQAHAWLSWWKRVEPPTVEDVEAFHAAKFKALGRWSPRNRAHYNGTIKRLYTWANDGEEPPTLRKLSTAPKEKRRILPFTEWTDVERMVTITPRPTSRFIVVALMESGARAEEFLGLKVGDLAWGPNSEYVKVHLPSGKTGEYSQVWVRSVPYLLAHLQLHPAPKDLDAPLIPSRKKHGGPLRPLQYQGLYHLLWKIGDAAKVEPEKRSPHAFRRGNASWLLSIGWSKEWVNMWQGREASSRLIDTYNQIRDVSNRMLESSGLAPKEQRGNGDEFMPLKCEWCGKLHPAKPAAPACLACGKGLVPMTVAQVGEVEKKTNRAEGLMERLFSDPEIRKRALEILGATP